MAINKVEYGGNTLIDITDTTATPESVESGKVFYQADGTRALGTGASDSGWINISATKGTWSVLRYRVIGKLVYIEGSSSSFKWSGSGGDNIKASAIPSEYCPPNYSRHYIIRTAGSRLCNLYVTTAGNIGVDYIINVSNGGNYTTAVAIDFQVSYLID